MSARANGVAWGLAVGIAWLWAWRHLSIEWRFSEQYQYGFGVPVLAGVLAWRRWAGPLAAAPTGWRIVLPLAAGIGAMALGELLRWHDPQWRATGGLLTVGATLITVACINRAGGAPLLRRQAFPLLFAWTAVPWPIPVETSVTQGLLRAITHATVALLNGCGIAAFQRGNAIELARGVVGIDDACSGIRSFQAALMAALFLGEFFRLSAGRRVGLLLLGVGVSMAANLLRVIALTLVTHRWGETGYAQAHDIVGGVTSAITFGLIVFAAARLESGSPRAALANESPRWRTGIGGGLAFACVAAIPVAAWIWFSFVAVAPSDVGAQWRLEARDLPPGWSTERAELAPAVRKALRFSQGTSLRVRTASGWWAQAIHLAWEPGTSIPALAFYHTPALCMPGIGWMPEGEPEARWIDVRGARLPCVVYRFRQGDAVQIAVQSFMNAGRGEFHILDPERLAGRAERLSMLWRAPRRQVSEELLLYLPDLGGSGSEARAITELLEAVLVRVD